MREENQRKARKLNTASSRISVDIKLIMIRFPIRVVTLLLMDAGPIGEVSGWTDSASECMLVNSMSSCRALPGSSCSLIKRALMLLRKGLSQSVSK